MNRVINWLQSGLRQVIAALLVAIVFLVIPAFSNNQALQAQADSYTVDKATVKRIQDRAEDLGDRSEKRGERPIGNTGLKNIKNLGENIPETLDMRRKQDTRDALGTDPDNVVNDAKNKVGGAVESAKQAVKDAID